MKDKKLVIIGSGPAGLTAAIYTSRAMLDTTVFMGLNPGGQLMQTSLVENFPGFPDGIQGPELMDRMIKQAQNYGSKLEYSAIDKIDLSSYPYTVFYGDSQMKADTIILAMGAQALWLGVKGEEKLLGRGVTACATCDGAFFKNKKVFVVGGGDAAMEDAIFLTNFTDDVTVVHRNENFKASKIMLERARSNSKISWILNSQVIECLGEDKLTGVKLQNTKDNTISEVSIEGLFVAIGHKPATEFLNSTSMLDEKGYVKATNHVLTNYEGIFVAGDVQDFRYKQAISAAGLGCMAALEAERYLQELQN